MDTKMLNGERCVSRYVWRNGMKCPEITQALPVRSVKDDFISPGGTKVRKTRLASTGAGLPVMVLVLLARLHLVGQPADGPHIEEVCEADMASEGFAFFSIHQYLHS